MKTDHDQRAYHRYEIPDGYLKYKKKGVRDMISPRNKASLINISKGGLSFVCHDDFTVGDKISSHLYLPHGTCWPLNGVVVWKGKNKNSESFVGVKFDTVKSADEFQAQGININAAKKLVALHQSAHIVVSYFLGFSPEYVSLDSNGGGEYKIDFGKKSSVAIPLMVGEISPDLFSFYSDMPKKMVFDLAKRICYILIAGGIAENIAKVKNIYIGINEVGLTGPDVSRASVLAEHFSVDLIKETIFLYECLKDERFWDPVDQLAHDLLSSSEKRLQTDAIAGSLKNSGCYDFLSD